MRYHFEKPIIYLSMYGQRYLCDHPVYHSCTLFLIEEKGLAVIQQLLDMTFEEFGSVPVMDGAYRKTRRGKRGKKPEAIFELHETENLIKLGDWILSGSYTPAELDAFMIFEPKPREINAPSFRDKIVQRNLTDNIVYPALAPSIPFNAFAAQTGKGQHYGLDMLERQMRTYFLRKKAEDEKRRKEQGLPYRPMEEWDYSDGWVIKGDVRKCFPSTDHDKLKAAVYPRLSDERFRRLLGLYIDQVKGLALGHQTSHMWRATWRCATQLKMELTALGGSFPSIRAASTTRWAAPSPRRMCSSTP